MKKKLTYKHDKESRSIIFNQPLRKCRDGIKVYFYSMADERALGDYPIATTHADGSNEYGWEVDFEILTIHIKRPIWFGLLGYKWEIAESE